MKTKPAPLPPREHLAVAVMTVVLCLATAHIVYVLQTRHLVAWSAFVLSLIGLMMAIAALLLLYLVIMTAVVSDFRESTRPLAVLVVGTVLAFILLELLDLGARIEYLTTLAGVLAAALLALVFGRGSRSD